MRLCRWCQKSLAGRDRKTLYCGKECRSFFDKMMKHRAGTAHANRQLIEAHLEAAALVAIREGDVGSLLALNRELRLTRRTATGNEPPDAESVDPLADFDNA